MQVAYLVPMFIALMAAIDVLDRWLKRFDEDVWEGDLLPERWIAWGAVRGGSPHHPNERLDARYFLLRLPSYEWMPHPWRSESDWMQRTLLRIRGSWHMTWAEPLWPKAAA